MESMLSEMYRAGLRELIVTSGESVERRHVGDYTDWRTVWEDYSTYGWRWYDASEHIRGQYERVKLENWRELPSWQQHEFRFVEGSDCPLVIPEGVEVREVNYSSFTDTFSDNREIVGVNAWGGESGEESAISCSCELYSGLMLRWEGSLMDAITTISGVSGRNKIII